MYFGTRFSVSVNYARTRTYSTVGMRFGMIKANRSGRSLVHPSQSKKSLRDSLISVVVVVVGGGEYWNYKESIRN